MFCYSCCSSVCPQLIYNTAYRVERWFFATNITFTVSKQFIKITHTHTHTFDMQSKLFKWTSLEHGYYAKLTHSMPFINSIPEPILRKFFLLCLNYETSSFIRFTLVVPLIFVTFLLQISLYCWTKYNFLPEKSNQTSLVFNWMRKVQPQHLTFVSQLFIVPQITDETTYLFAFFFFFINLFLLFSFTVWL